MRPAMMRRSSSTSSETIDETESPVEELEKGSLTILTQRDIWQQYILRPQIQNASEPQRFFEIPYARIVPPNNVKSNIKKYVVYDLRVRQDGTHGNCDQNPATIERRYRNFLALYTGLRKDHSQFVASIIFPKKVILGNFSSDLIYERSALFEIFLDHIVKSSILRESTYFLQFLQENELTKACQLLDERRHEQAVPILENCFRLLNKIYTDRSKAVLLLLCRLVAACTTSPIPHASAERWCELALHRYESVCDADLLALYIPLLQTCVHLWWQRGRDNSFLTERLNGMELKGINVKAKKTLTQAIHALDPRTETI